MLVMKNPSLEQANSLISLGKDDNSLKNKMFLNEYSGQMSQFDEEQSLSLTAVQHHDGAQSKHPRKVCV